ncbi:DUF1542 domain-containing protein, partial [Streptococcus equi]|uniref:DUF1542 domain-containing protein n=1 Tax=Streptococcus equi TaxID=1336 RepID=UPI00055EE113
MEKLRKFIESKKMKSSSKKPRYGIRKLSVGVVSCMIGWSIFFGSPVVVQAAELETSLSDTFVEESQKDSDTVAEETHEDLNGNTETTAEEVLPETLDKTEVGRLVSVLSENEVTTGVVGINGEVKYASQAVENAGINTSLQAKSSEDAEQALETKEESDVRDTEVLETPQMLEGRDAGSAVPTVLENEITDRAAEANGDTEETSQEIEVIGHDITLVRGVEKIKRFPYVDPENKVKSAKLVEGGSKEETTFINNVVDIKITDDNNVEISFKLPDDFQSGVFSNGKQSAGWTRYISLLDEGGSSLNSTGLSDNKSKLYIRVQTQAGAYEPSLQTKVNVNDASNLSDDEIESIKQAFETAKEDANSDWGKVAKTIEANQSNVTIRYNDGTTDTLDISDFINEVPKFENDDRPIFLIPDVPVEDAKVTEKIRVTDDTGIKSVERGHERNQEDTDYKENFQDPLHGTTIKTEKDEDGKGAFVWYGIETAIEESEINWVKQEENKIHRSLWAVDSDGAGVDSKSIEIVLYQPTADEKNIGTKDSLTVSEDDILDNVNLGFIHYEGDEATYADKITTKIKSVKKGDTEIKAENGNYTLQRDVLDETTYTAVVTVESAWGQTKDVEFNIIVAQQDLDVTKIQAGADVEAKAAAKISEIEKSDMTEEEKDAAKAEVNKDKLQALENIEQKQDAQGVLDVQKVAEKAITTDKSKLQTEYDKKDTIEIAPIYTGSGTDTKEAYDQAQTKAKEILDKADASNEEVEEALTALKEAKAALNGDVEVKQTSENINLVRGVEQTVKFYYTDENDHVKSAGFVSGGNQADTAFNNNAKIELKEDENGKYVEVTFTLPDDFKDGKFPDEVTPEQGGSWTKYLALYDNEEKSGQPLNDVGNPNNPSKLMIVVKTQAGAYTPTLPDKIEVNDASSLTEENIEAVKEAIKEANKDALWDDSAKIEADATNVTITYKDGTKDIIPISTLVDDSKPKAKKAIEEAADKKAKEMDQNDQLTEEEKAAAKEEIKKDKEKALADVAQAGTPDDVATAKDAGIAAIEADKSLLQAEAGK